MLYVIGIMLAYLIGSIPFGLIVVRYKLDQDIRKLGSGNIGATNVARVLGFRWGIIVFLLDGLKGGIPTYIAMHILRNDMIIPFIAIMSVLGHIMPVYDSKLGGKAVSTVFCILAVLDIKMFMIITVIWILSFMMIRRSAYASIIAAIEIIILSIRMLEDMISYQNWQVFLYIVLGLIILIRHKNNIVEIFMKLKRY